MKIIYKYKDMVGKHFSSNNPLIKDEKFVIKNLSQRYSVTIRTVQNWKRNDRVPKKYIEKCRFFRRQ